MSERLDYREIYLRMVRIRYFEESVIAAMARGEGGGGHLSIGQEATAVGACMALAPDDFMTGTHRSHGHEIAKGAALAPLMAELFGKETGVCKGKGGSMHLADFSIGSLGECAIVGSAMPVATGAALSAQMQGTGKVVLCFFGDGASNTGAFHESLNLASLWSLPIIFLCENNLYAVTEPIRSYLPIADIADRASAYGMPGHVVDGQDVGSVHATVSEAVARAREGSGPTLIEAKTYRFRDHAEFGARSDSLHYRTAGEVDDWMTNRDPIALFRGKLVDSGQMTETELDEIESGAHAEIEEALEYARSSPEPSAENIYEDLYVEPILR